MITEDDRFKIPKKYLNMPADELHRREEKLFAKIEKKREKKGYLHTSVGPRKVGKTTFLLG